jgi:ferritin-like metal-binding protein YciE
MSSLHEQLHSYLSDAHSIEEQALVQMRAAPKIARDPRLEAIFAEHLIETRQHERWMRGRLEDHGEKPSVLKEAVMKAGGGAFVLFARSQLDTPGKLVAHAYSYEHLELASYDLLIGVAERARDAATVDVARRIRDEEGAMIERLEAAFDDAVEASLRELEPDDLGDQLNTYLADAHAIEEQAIQLLERAPSIGGDPELDRIYADHLEQTREQKRTLEEILRDRGASPSRLKDAAMRLGALNWAGFFAAHPDTPGKLAAFAFAFEHLEAGGYELLERVARRAGDERTAAAAQRIRGEERAMAERLRASFERALEASLQAVGAAG